MGVRAVLDTNAVIYLQKGWLEVPLPVGEYLISVITEIELLSFAGLEEAQKDRLLRLIEDMEVVEIDQAVKQMRDCATPRSSSEAARRPDCRVRPDA